MLSGSRAILVAARRHSGVLYREVTTKLRRRTGFGARARLALSLEVTPSEATTKKMLARKREAQAGDSNACKPSTRKEILLYLFSVYAIAKVVLQYHSVMDKRSSKVSYRNYKRQCSVIIT